MGSILNRSGSEFQAWNSLPDRFNSIESTVSFKKNSSKHFYSITLSRQQLVFMIVFYHACQCAVRHMFCNWRYINYLLTLYCRMWSSPAINLTSFFSSLPCNALRCIDVSCSDFCLNVRTVNRSILGLFTWITICYVTPRRRNRML